MHILSRVRSAASAALFATVSAAFAPTAHAQAMQYTDFGSIQLLEAGWSQDTMAVTHSAPLVNPSGCPVTNAGYATDPADAGHNLFHTVALAAFLNRKEVALLISGCVYSKPKIISVRMR